MRVLWIYAKHKDIVTMRMAKMALAKRIIPCLDCDRGRVVKGVNFVDIRDAGDPIEISKSYCEAALMKLHFLISPRVMKIGIQLWKLYKGLRARCLSLLP